MSNIDERVVKMSFDNAAFLRNIADTLASLEKLNKSLKLQEATKGLEGVGEATRGISLGPLLSGLQTATEKFNSLSVVGLTAIADITTKVVDLGIRLTKSFTLDPIKAGFENYETQINAVQTILANTASAGTKLSDVNKALSELNTYANQTVYNFGEMTKNIGTFTAAGVDLKTSVEAIKGIANLAAIEGSTSEQASTAMYQLSQAIASGTVKLQDWNSVVNAGLGGKTFQDALISTARASGVAIDSIIKKAGGFRNSLQEGWLTSGILTKTLAQFTGDLSVKQIQAMGYTKKQAEQIYALGQTAVGAATKIKTATQLTDALKEEVATAYGTIFKTIFGDIGQATDLFSNIHNVAENALTGPIYALNTLLQDWSKLGGRNVLIQGFTQAFQDLGAVLKPIKDAFREIFPPETALELYNITYNFNSFMQKLKIGAVAGEELRHTFAGIFAVVDILWTVIKKFGGALMDAFSNATDSSGGILEFTARVGDFLVRLDQAIKKGDDLTKFFNKLGAVLSIPVLLLQAFAQYVGMLMDKIDGNKLAGAFDGVTEKLGPIGKLSQIMNESFGAMFGQLVKLGQTLDRLLQKAVNFFFGIGQGISQAFNQNNFQQIITLLDTGLVGGIIVALRKLENKFFAGKTGGTGGFGGLVNSISETFEGLTKTLETMQGTLKAATLLEIALAIGLLTISVIGLSHIDSASLTRSSVALTLMFTELVASMAIFQKFIGSEDFLKMPFMMGSLILLAIAVDILTSAVKRLAKLDWDGVHKGVTGISILMTVLAADIRLMGNPARMISIGFGLTSLASAIKTLSGIVVTLAGLSWDNLSKGLIGVATLLTGLALFSKFAEANAAGAIQGYGIVLLAGGIKILAIAMADFGQFSWTEIAKGLVSMAAGLTAMGLALKFIPAKSLFSSAGVLVVALSLGMIGDAIKKMGDLKGEVIAKGLLAMAGGLALIAATLYLLPASKLISAAAIFIVAASLQMIGDALAKMGKQSWTSIAKGLIAMAGSLLIISVAVSAMETSLTGAAALLVISAALVVIAEAMQTMGQMSWGEILGSLVELAGVFVVIGLAGYLLAPVAPVILSLAGALALFGLSAVEAGIGITLFAAGLAALAAGGAAYITLGIAYVSAWLGLLPEVGKALGLTLIAFAQSISTGGPALTKAFVTLIGSILDAIQQLTPKIVETFFKVLQAILDAALKYVPKMTDTGLKILTGFLNGIANNIQQVVTAATHVVVNFLKGISDNLPTLVQAGFDFIIKFINSVAKAIDDNAEALGKAGGDLAVAIVKGMAKGLIAGVKEVGGAAKNLASSALDTAAHWLGINSPSKEFYKLGVWSGKGMANGLSDTADIVATASQTVANTALSSMSKSIANMSDALSADIEIRPTITPVLDLSEVKKNAGKIGGMLSTAPIVVGTTYSNAIAASTAYSENQVAASASTAIQPKSNDVTFIQNNTSPKALSPAEIYRLTNNQLSVARGALVYQAGDS